MPPADKPPETASWSLIILVAVMFVAIAVAGILFYQLQEQQIERQVTGDLSAIAELKAGQITVWREDRLHDARVIAAGAFFKDGADHFLTYGDNESREKILDRFREMNASPQYHNVLLVDTGGNVRLSLDPAITSLSPDVKTQVVDSFAGGRAMMTDFHHVPGTDHIHLDVIAPLVTGTNGSQRSVGAVLLSIDPEEFLYPFIQSWPVPSNSAETLLVEREGDHVLFLNNLRHLNDTALNLTIPLTQMEVPAVMAVRGTTGAFTGLDYRGVDVISVLNPVYGSTWFMVTKIDTEEAYAAWRTRSGLIISLVFTTLAGAVIVTGLFWQRRQKYYYRSLYATEAAQRKEEEKNRERLEVLLKLGGMDTAGDQELADFVLDAGCRLTDSSLAFIGVMSPDESVFDITSWSKSAMKDCSVAASPIHFPIAKAGIWAEAVRQRKPLMVNDYAAPQPGKKGLPAGHVPVTRFVSVPVTEEQRIVMVCAVANKKTDYTTLDVDNITLLMQGVWNHRRKRKADEALRQKTTDLEAAYEEITATDEELRANYEELARNQQALKASEGRLRRFYDSGLFGVIFWTMDGKITDANDVFLEMTGYSREELEAGKIDWAAMTPPEFRYLDEKSVEELNATGINRLPFEKEYYHKDGSRLPILIAGAMLDEQRFDGVAFVLDISELKTARTALAESERKYRNLYQYAQVGLFETSLRDATVVTCNQRYADLFGVDSAAGSLGQDVTGAYVNPDERDEVARILRESGQIIDYVARFRNRKTGREFWGQFSARYNYERDIAEGTVIDVTAEKEAEARLKETNDYLTSLFDYANAPIIIWDPQFRITRFNHAFEDMTGMTEQEVAGKHLSILFPETSRDASLDLIRKTLAGERWEVVEIPIRHISGEARIVLWNSANIVDNRGTIISTIAHGQDITERKAAEEEIRSASAFLDMVIDMSPFSMWISDQDGIVTRVNRSLCQTIHLTPDEIVGKYNVLRDTNLEAQGVMPNVRAVFDTHTPARFSIPWKVADAGDVDFRGGRDMYIDVSLFPILNTRGELTNVVCQWVDITERKTAEDALRQSEEKYRILFTRMIEGSALHEIVYNASGHAEDYRILDVNPAFESTLGIRRETVVGKSSREAYGVDSPPYLETYARVAATGEPEVFETYFAPLRKHFSISVYSPVKGRFATIFEDITERKQAEALRERLIKELEQKNAELERFTYTVSHDLKSPLITIKGFAGLLEDDASECDPVKLKKDVNRIITAADTMQELLADVLELSRIGRVAGPPEKIPFGTIAREAVELLAGPLAERGVWVDLAPDLPVVRVDHARIREAMTNILENAIKFLGDRPDPVIRIGADLNGETPVFFVQDNGIGINPRYLERIFNLFEKLDVSAHGTGIGLTIVRRIIEVHGGKIWAESEGVGKGTTFRFTLSREKETDHR